MGEKQGRVQGKTALVTGASSGIGLAAAVRLAEEGANVALLDVKEERLCEAAKLIERTGADYLLLEADISKEEEVKRAVDRTVRQWGTLNVLFANAGINGVLSPIESLELEDWERTISVNLTGTFLTVKHAIEPLKKQGGSIIVTASVNGNRIFSNFGFSAYSSSKAAQVAFAKMAALELARYRIRVNAICPGAIKTNIGQNTERMPDVDEIVIPVEYPEGNMPLEHRPGDPRQVANVVLFLASDDSDHVTGDAIYVDGAESLLRG